MKIWSDYLVTGSHYLFAFSQTNDNRVLSVEIEVLITSYFQTGKQVILAGIYHGKMEIT